MTNKILKWFAGLLILIPIPSFIMGNFYLTWEYTLLANLIKNIVGLILLSFSRKDKKEKINEEKIKEETYNGSGED